MEEQPLFIVFIHLSLGGIERKIVDMVNHLSIDRPTLPIYVLLQKKSPYSIQNQISNKHVTVIAYADTIIKNIPFSFATFVIYQVWKLKPKAILSFLDMSACATILAKRIYFWRKIRVVVGSDHYVSKIIPAYSYPYIRRWLIKTLYPHADKIITCTEVTKNDLVHAFGIQTEKIRVLKNWTQICPTKPSRSKIYDLVYAGRLEREKNVLGLLQTVHLLMVANSKLSMLIVGEGSQRSALQKYTKEQNLSDNITFTEAVKNVKQYLSKARLFVYSPNQQADGFPITLLESMSVGVPVLTRYFEGADEVIQNSVNGFIAYSRKEFIQKAMWLLNHPKERKRVVFQAKKYVSKYHAPANMLAYFDELKI